MKQKIAKKVKTKLKVGDKVQVIAGADKGKQGKILVIDRENNRVVVEGVRMLTKHIKPGKNRDHQNGGIVNQEGYIHASNVMYLAGGKPSRLGLTVTKTGGKTEKKRVAKATKETLSK